MIKIDRFFIFLIFILSITVGFIYLESGYIFPAESGDSIHYNNAALNFIKTGEFFSNNIVARSGPGYPFFLSIIYKIFGENNFNAVRILQIFLLAGTGILIFLIARKFLNLTPVFAFFSSLTLVFWPYFIVWSSLILTEILFIFFLTLAVFFALKFKNKKLFKDSLFSVLTLGIATLIRPEIIFLPFWLLFLWFIFKQRRQNLKINFKRTILALIILILIISPWLIKNIVLFQNPLPVYDSLKWGEELNKENAGIFSHLKNTAVKEPISIVKNIIYFWNPGTQGLRAESLSEKYNFIEPLFLIYKIIFFIILAAAFASPFLVKKQGLFLFWAIILYYWAIHGLIFPSPRHTLPIIPLIILLAWMSIAALYKFYRFRVVSNST
jgi:hypothetical protein